MSYLVVPVLSLTFLFLCSASTASILTRRIIDDFSSPLRQNSNRQESNTPIRNSVTGTPSTFATSSRFAKTTNDVENVYSGSIVEFSQEETTSASNNLEEKGNKNNFLSSNNEAKDDDEDSQSESYAFYDDEYNSVDESTLCPTVVAADRQMVKTNQTTLSVMQTQLEENNDESNLNTNLSTEEVSTSGPSEEEEEEEASTLCPTIVAQKNEPTSRDRAIYAPYQPKQQLGVDDVIEQQSLSQSYHVVVRDGLASPAPTALTMDATMYLNNETEIMSQQSTRIADDTVSIGNDTQETPVLDRYRIVADDGSIGFKVVPNERSSRKKKVRTPQQQGTTSSARYDTSRDGSNRSSKLDSDSHVPKTVKFSNKSQNNFHKEDSKGGRENFDVRFAAKTPQAAATKTYRKTPYRKQEDISPEDRKIQFDLPQQNFDSFLSPPPNTTHQVPRKTPYNNIIRDSATKKVYRKTPFRPVSNMADNNKENDDARVRFEVAETPPAATVEAKMYRKTPYTRVQFNKENDDTRVRFEVSETPTAAGVGEKTFYRKTPYTRVHHLGSSRSPFADLPTSDLINSELMASPVSLASTLTGCTGMMQIVDNSKELFPAPEPSAVNHSRSSPSGRKSDFSRKSASTMIALVTEDEWNDASPVVKMQFNLKEVNQAVRALNGAAFLRQQNDDEDDVVQLTDSQAYRILRNVGFKRRRCKGMLMSLCHWGRLKRGTTLEESFYEVQSSV